MLKYYATWKDLNATIKQKLRTKPKQKKVSKNTEIINQLINSTATGQQAIWSSRILRLCVWSGWCVCNLQDKLPLVVSGCLLWKAVYKYLWCRVYLSVSEEGSEYQTDIKSEEEGDRASVYCPNASRTRHGTKRRQLNLLEKVAAVRNIQINIELC